MVALHKKSDWDWNALWADLKPFSKLEKGFKLDLNVSAKVLTLISPLSPIEFFAPDWSSCSMVYFFLMF